MLKRSLELLDIVPDGQYIVGIAMFQGRLIVATDKGIFRLVEEKLEPIELMTIPPIQPPPI